MAEGIKVRWGFELLLIIVGAVFYGSIAFIGLLVTIVRKGASKVFCVQARNVRPEVLCNSTLGEHGFVRLRSVRLKLHYVASGPADKPLMLFLHGFPEFWYSWRHQLKEFSKDYRAVAFDMRGYGDSDKPSGIFQYTMDKLVEDVDQLITELGYKKCVLVGHDWGGAVAWSYAALHPDRVEKLVVGNCPHPTAFRIHCKSAFSQVKKSWYMFLFQVPVLPQILMRADDLASLERSFTGRKIGAKQGSFTPEDIEAYKYTFASYDDLCGPINFYRASMRYHAPQVDESWRHKISVPTLMIWGTRDNALEKEMAELSGRFVEQYTVHYVEGASHWVQQDEPEQFNSAMRKFLSGSSR